MAYFVGVASQTSKHVDGVPTGAHLTAENVITSKHFLYGCPSGYLDFCFSGLNVER